MVTWLKTKQKRVIMYNDNGVGRAKKHQQMLRSHGDLSRQIQDDMDAEDGYRKDERITELESENRKIKEKLERSKGLARMTLLERDGLVEVIRHLKDAWTPPVNELHYKDKIKPLMDEKVQMIQNDPKNHEKASEKIEKIVNEQPPKPRKPA